MGKTFITTISLAIVVAVFSGCVQQPPLGAWEHLQAALEDDETSVIEYMALEHLQEIVAYDNSAALQAAMYANPPRRRRMDGPQLSG
jgi:hypothetical protein